MSAKIEYIAGEPLGPYDIIFVKEIEPYIRPDGRKERKGLFVCPFCNKEFSTTFYSIKKGKTRSCGCYRKEQTSKRNKQDLTGRKFGRLTVLKEERKDQKGRIVWLCKCECGKYHEVVTAYLNNGSVKSCGCLAKETARKNGRAVIHDLTGQRFGRLVVLQETSQRSGTNIIWKCKCDCGNIAYVEGPSLLRGDTKSCGCYQKECCQQLQSKNLLNQKFGKLTVIEKIEERKGTQVQWKCLCECGNIKIVTTHSLLAGNVRSCGCLRMSNGESQIAQILEDLNISYQQEYLLPNNQRFDFYLTDFHCAIEYDGKQHFEPIDFFGGEQTFNQQQKRDAEKEKYCYNNNIKLIRIPYTITTYNKIKEKIEKELYGKSPSVNS